MKRESSILINEERRSGSDVAPINEKTSHVSRLSSIRFAHIEIQGIERIPEDERDTDTRRVWDNLLLFLSANFTVAAVAVGMLSKGIYGLSFQHAVIIEVCFGLAASACTGFISIMGPKTGLRTMVILRFSVGWVGGIIFSIMNILTLLGWTIATVVLGGQLLAFVNPGSLPLIAGIVIIAVCCLVPGFFGYRLVNTAERYSWIPLSVLLMILWGLGARAGFDFGAAPTTERSLASGVLGFGGIVFGNTIGYAAIIADYNCRLPANSSTLKIYLISFFGIFFPCLMSQMLGSALGCINSTYVDEYNGDIGLFLFQLLSPWGVFGRIVLALCALSLICPNVLPTYSIGLSFQALGGPFTRVPRVIWTTVGWCAYTVAAIAGRDSFVQILSNLIALSGYWTTILAVVVIEEHWIFRRPKGRLSGYHLDDWNSPGRLPVGAAGIAACLLGAMGVVLGMSQEWYFSPVARLIDPNWGADMGFELAAVLCALTYPPLRVLEIRMLGR